jgi:hypothetical protein
MLVIIRKFSCTYPVCVKQGELELATTFTMAKWK